MAVNQLTSLGLTALRNNFSELKNPYKLTFAITYWCQSRCLTCNIWDIRPKGELTLDEIKNFASKNNFFKWIEITGGEPFLRSDIVDIVRTFHKNNKDLYLVTMPTNSLCNREMVLGKIKEMLDIGIPKLSITVSLDGYKELHDKIRGIPGNFEKAVSMFKDLQELSKQYKNLFFVFGYTVSPFNQGSFSTTYSEVKKLIPNIRYNDFHFNIGQISGSYYRNESMTLSINKDIVAEEIKTLIKNRKFEFGAIPIIETVFLKRLVDYVLTGKPQIKSRSLDASLFMDSFGNVYPSIMWDKKIGNIRESDFYLKKMWYNQTAKEIRKEIKSGNEPSNWTACEAYQSIAGNVAESLLTMFSK